MRGFSKPPGETIAFTRGHETIEITLHPLPMGFRSWLQRAFPMPVKFVNGKPVDPEPGSVNEWNDLATLLMLVRAAAPGTFETELPKPGAGADFYRKRAERVREEFRAAHFTDGDMRAMWLVVNRLSSDTNPETRLGGAEGNS